MHSTKEGDRAAKLGKDVTEILPNPTQRCSVN